MTELLTIVAAVAGILICRHVVYRSEPPHEGPRVRCVYPTEHRPCIACQRQGYCQAEEGGR